MQVCINCRHQNRAGVVFCENCGTSLLSRATTFNTRSLADSEYAHHNLVTPNYATSELIEKQQVRKNTILQFKVGEESEMIVVPIQERIIFGRRDTERGFMPDVDLTPFSGYRMGVSRRHAEIRLAQDKSSPLLYLLDTGSSNGTFLNDIQLPPHQEFVLYDGSIIHLGQLKIRVRFRDH